jgi:hypothetical protein
MVLAAAALACHTPPREQLTGRASDEWVRSYTLNEGGEVQITNGLGAVDVRGVDGNTVEVRAERIARASSDAAAAEIVPRINIREEISPDRVTLRAEPLGGIVIGVSTEVRYHVRAPRAATVRVRAVGGALTASGFSGRAILTAVNGSLTGQDLNGGVEARATNGAAKIELGAFGKDLVDLRVTNGSLELVLPSTADANLTASVTNGKIDASALRLEPLGEQTARRIRGRLNAGGTPIDIVTTNGSITIRPR